MEHFVKHLPMGDLLSSAEPPESKGRVLLVNERWCVIHIEGSKRGYYIGHMHLKRQPRNNHRYKWYYYPHTKCRICIREAPGDIAALYNLMQL